MSPIVIYVAGLAFIGSAAWIAYKIQSRRQPPVWHCGYCTEKPLWKHHSGIWICSKRACLEQAEAEHKWEKP